MKYGLILFPLLLSACSDNKSESILGGTTVLGTVVAEEAAQLAGPQKQIVLIVPDASWGPPSSVQKECEATLKDLGYSIKLTKQCALGDPMRSGEIGLKAADFIETLQNASGTGAIISFAGAPLLKQGDVAQIPQQHPPVLVVSTAILGEVPGVRTDPKLLTAILKDNVIQLAIIDGADPSPGKDSKRKAFAQQFQILRGSTN